MNSEKDIPVDLKSRSLYSRLKRLFSTDVIVRNVGGKMLKIKDTDQVQYATDRNSLRDRFNRVRTSGYNQYNRDFTLAYQASRIELFRDYDTMDMDPIIASALDIYADECISGETTIPLLNGEKVTIAELYRQNRTNFWVYSVNDVGNFSPQLCERVAYNGKKKMYKVTLDDGTELKCTPNHIWMKSDGTQLNASELQVGDGLKVFSTKLSDSKFMFGYEMLLDGDGKWKYTHRLVANSVDTLVKEKSILESEQKIIHHTSFNKLNNSPECLKWMGDVEHRRLHADFNKKLWADPSITHEYKEKTRLGHKKYWTPERRKDVSIRQKKFMEGFLKDLSTEDRNNIFANRGSKNGVCNKDYKLEGGKNGRWEGFMPKSQVNIDSYECDIVSGMSASELRKKYNLNSKDIKSLNVQVCKKHGIYRIYQLSRKLELNKLYKDVSIPLIKFIGESELKSGKNVYRDLSLIGDKLNISNAALLEFIWKSGYKGIRDLMESENHRVVSIEVLDGEYDAYDLVNVGKSTHLYAIECKDGSKLITHNCLTDNEFGYVLNITAADNNIKKILDNLFYDILHIDFNLWSWTRNMVKYGDFYLKMNVSPEYGVYLVEPLSAYSVVRVENSDPLNKNYVRYQVTTPVGVMEELESFQIAHFRLISDSNFLPYGKSMIEGARRVWKQLSLMEDAMLIHRIMRAPDKRVFKIDVGNIPPSEVDNYMERTISKMKKVPYMDENTGDYNLRFNMQNMVEDFYLPVRGSDNGTSIEPLGGMEFTGTDDIEYLRNKMMAALKIPKAFLGYEEDLSGKATLAAEDVRFSRTVTRIQKILISELTKIAVVHLYSQGYTDANLVDFELELTNPSTIFEKEKVDIWASKVSLAKDMIDSKLFSTDWIYKDVFKLSDDDILKIKNEVITDVKQSWRFSQIEDQGNDPAVSLQKVNDDGELEDVGGKETDVDMGSGGGGPPLSMGDEPAGDEVGLPGEEGDVPPDEADGGGIAPPDGEGGESDGESTEKPTEKPISEKAKRPSQKGEKDARDYPFGEDPFGRLENNADYRKNPIRHKFKKNSPLGFESVITTNLSNFLSGTVMDTKRELLKESAARRSMMDESNILDDKRSKI